DQGERDVRLVIEDVVGALGLAAGDELATHDDPALGEADLLADLQHLVPPGLPQGGRDELGANVAFAEGPLIHRSARPANEVPMSWTVLDRSRATPRARLRRQDFVGGVMVRIKAWPIAGFPEPEID